MRRLLWGAALAVTAVFAVAGLVTAATPRAEVSLAEQTRAVAQTLRCPTCLGEDVADSAAPLAESMRLVVAEQLAAGASPAQVRAWFAQRYGDEVLLDPPARGHGWLLWLVPLALLAGWLFYLLVERNTHRLARRVALLLAPRKAHVDA